MKWNVTIDKAHYLYSSHFDIPYIFNEVHNFRYQYVFNEVRRYISLQLLSIFSFTIKIIACFSNDPGSTMFGTFFWSHYTCQTTLIFGTLKDGNKVFINFTSNTCFSNRSVFKNGVNPFLRVESLFVGTDRDCHVWCKFNLVIPFRITVNFGTMIENSLLINTLASNLKILYTSYHTILFKFHQHIVQILIK